MPDPSRPRGIRRLPVVVLGGTFDGLHAGHRALLETAFLHGTRVGIGLTTDALLRRWRSKRGRIRPFAERRRMLEEYLGRRFPHRSWWVIPLKDRWGATFERRTRGLVVSEETAPVARAANRVRKRRGLPPLRVIVLKRILADDLLPISSTRMRQGLVDARGRRLRPLVVGVGTKNPVKIAGIRRAFIQLFPNLSIRLVPHDVPGRRDQPRGMRAGYEGALRRARFALGRGDYGVGVESTLAQPPGCPVPQDIHCVVIRDAAGGTLHSTSLGFPYPDEVVSGMVRGTTVEEALRGLGGPSRLGRRPGGALGYLSGGVLSREEAVREAVAAAFVPRLAARNRRLPATRRE